jgi:VWFA-related protein
MPGRLMRAVLSGTLSLIVAGFMTTPARGQAGQAEAQGPPLPTIRVSTHLVLIDVVVTDKYGQPIPGLRAQDFTVQEKGKDQKISFFTPPNQSGNLLPPASLLPGTYSNRPEYRAPSGPVTVVLLDAANTSFQDQSYGRLQMLKFVRDQYQPGQRIAIFTLTNKLALVQDFSSDPQILLNAVLQYSPNQGVAPRSIASASEVPNGLPGSALARANADIRNFQAGEVAYVMDRRVETTLSAMRSLARILGGIPGRKNIIWLTAGFPFSLFPDDLRLSGMPSSDPTRCPAPACVTMSQRRLETAAGGQYDRYAEQVRDVASRLASSQVAIYPVDVRGLETNATINTIASQMTMEEMAWETGGQAFVNRNNIRDGIALAFRDSSGSYTVGYYPDNKNWDRRYRAINVKVDRGGVEVRHRRGYFAIDPAQVKDRKPDQELTDALEDAAPNTLVVFDATVTQADKVKTRVEFLIDASSISAEDAPGGKKVDVNFYAAIFSSAGKMLVSQSVRLDHTFPVDTYRQILQQGMRVHIDLDSPPGKNELRMAVRDARTGYLGTISASITR